MEFSATQSLPFQSRVQEHYLASYQASFIAVCTAQFSQKAFHDGIDVSPWFASATEGYNGGTKSTLQT